MSLEDRRLCIKLAQDAVQNGAREKSACEVMNLSWRTFRRWKAAPDVGDQRRGPRTLPRHALSPEERKQIIAIANQKEYRDLSPWQIVAKLADQGTYIASESSIYRLFRKEKMLSHRLRSEPPKHEKPQALIADRPNKIYTWDITYMKGPVKGQFFYLYLFLDIYSRKIVGWQVKETESAELAADLVRRICEDEGIQPNTLSLHSDNGASMKGATMLATLQSLGVVPSFSRPGVSDDNPYSEALFRTLKYRPSYPDGRFESLDEARQWVSRFADWYNTGHMHSGIKFVTPQARHEGRDREILNRRDEVYIEARKKTPYRWTGKTRNWNPVGSVNLNPPKCKSSSHWNLTIPMAA